MSAIFVRPGEEEGIEMPVKEAISKSMICMMFDLDEKAYFYILKEDGSIASTMLGIESTFAPTEPGKYCVKTDEEVDDVDTVGVNKLEEAWKSFKIYQKETLRRQPTEMIVKILNKMDYHSFAKLAQTCEWMQKTIEELGHKLEIRAPISLTVTFGYNGLDVTGNKVLGKLDKPKKEVKFNIDEEDLHVLKSFRVQRVSVNATLGLPLSCIDVICNALQIGVTTDILDVKGVFPSRSVVLTETLKPKIMHFVGNTKWGLIDTSKTKTITLEDRAKTDFFIPEEFPYFDLLAIADSEDMEKGFQTDLFMRSVRKAAVVCFRPFKNFTSLSHLLKAVFEQYLTQNDRGINRVVKIYIEHGVKLMDVVDAILQGRKFERMENPISVYGDSCCSARIYHTECGMSTEFLVQFTKFDYRYLTFSFGVASNDFWKYMEMAYKDQ